MWPSIEFPPLLTQSIVGFAEAVTFSSEVAADLTRRLEGRSAGSELPEALAVDLAPAALAAVDAANSMHFRFDLTALGGSDSATVLRPEGGSISIEGLDGDHPDRKITMVVTLSGSATITFPTVSKERTLVAGTIAMFPSFLANTVDDQGGDLVAVVLYATGPSFR